MAQRTRHYNRNMGLKTWKKWTDWPLMVLSVVFLVVYSWEILSRTHIALCETVINVIWVVFVVDYVVSLWLADDRWRWFKHNLFTLLTIALPMLRPLRLLRLLTVLHVLNRTSGMSITDAQLSTAANVTAGYPYMIQLVGYHIWDAADMRDSDTIIDADVTAGIEEARIDLDNAVCIPELQGLSKNDREYLEAMAASDGPSPTVNVAQRMGKTPNYAATYRKRLLDAFVIRETERGEVDFAVPFLREYLRRNQ